MIEVGIQLTEIQLVEMIIASLEANGSVKEQLRHSPYMIKYNVGDDTKPFIQIKFNVKDKLIANEN